MFIITCRQIGASSTLSRNSQPSRMRGGDSDVSDSDASPPAAADEGGWTTALVDATAVHDEETGGSAEAFSLQIAATLSRGLSALAAQPEAQDDLAVLRMCLSFSGIGVDTGGSAAASDPVRRGLIHQGLNKGSFETYLPAQQEEEVEAEEAEAEEVEAEEEGAEAGAQEEEEEEEEHLTIEEQLKEEENRLVREEIHRLLADQWFIGDDDESDTDALSDGNLQEGLPAEPDLSPTLLAM